MISNELTDELNQQIKEELQSEFYYLGMAAYFREEDWEGFAHFMEVQAEEEREHAMEFYNFVDEVGSSIVIPEVEKPSISYESIEEVFETALKQEQHITRRIHRLMELARDHNDYEAESLLQWFVDEQVEEENLMDNILQKVRRAGDDTAALLILDEELGDREELE